MISRIGIVAGEASGDALGAELIQAFRLNNPNIVVEGIAGPKMLNVGCRSFFPIDRLSVMGFLEPIKRLPELFSIRRHLKNYFLENPPDIFIGIDAPDFNLGLMRALREKGIPTVQYVSPSVWAWRKGRIKNIKKSVDLMLTLFPFEADFYQEHKVPVCFTGHPFADQIPIEQRLSTNPPHPNIIAILPGSRDGELKQLAELYCKTALFCYEKQTNLTFVVPVVSVKHQQFFQAIANTIAPHVPIKVEIGNMRDCIANANAVLVTSGTATLEVMLYKKPMVVAYRTHPLTYAILKQIIKIPYFSLPNLLAKEGLVPEFIREKPKPEVMGRLLLNYLSSKEETERLEGRFIELHKILKRDASLTAASAIIDLLKNKNKGKNHANRG